MKPSTPGILHFTKVSHWFPPILLGRGTSHAIRLSPEQGSVLNGAENKISARGILILGNFCFQFILVYFNFIFTTAVYEGAPEY